MARKFSNEWFAQRSFNRKLKIEFLEDLVDALHSNITVKEQLKQLVSYGSKKHAVPARYMLAIMEKAKPFSVAMEGWFPSVVIQAVKAGEANRKLDMALENAQSALTNGGVIGKIIGSNLYSIFLLSLATIANITAYEFIFTPKLEEVSFRYWSPISKLAYNIGGVFVHDSVYILIGMAIVFIGISKFMGMKTNKFRSRFDSFPIFTQYRLFNAVTLLSSLTLMFKTRMALNASLPLLSNSTEGYLHSHIEIMRKRLKSGKNISLGSVLRSGLFEDGEISRIETLTSKNNRGIGIVLEKATNRHQKLLDSAIKKYGLILQAFSMLYMAGMLLITFIGIAALNMIGL